MAKKKADYLAEAEALGLEVTEKNTIAEIQAAIEATGDSATAPKKEEKSGVAKAGKRSAKALKEAEQLAEKEDRKARIAAGEETVVAPEKKKGPVPVTRPLIERRSKAYRAAVKDIDLAKAYEPKAAMELVVKTSTVKFDATIELHVRLNVDPRQADQNVRGTVVLPHGTGKTVTVAVFAPTDQHEAASKAGADIVGEETILEMLKKEEANFDVLIATPQLMVQLGKFAKFLGPKGLMPNPKSGTVSTNVAEAVKTAKAGQVEFRVDPQGIIHLGIGKLSFGVNKLVENYQTVLDAIQNARPSSLKVQYVESVTLTSSMGPGIKVVV